MLHIGSALITLRIPGSHSLKHKRGLVRSAIARLRQRFNISVIEVRDVGQIQACTLGICCLSNSSRHAGEMISKVVSYVELFYGEWEMIDSEVEVLSIL